MVLQELENGPDSFSDNPYPSDDDAYTSNTPPGQRYDASSLPQPLPILGPVLGFSSAAVRFRVDSTIKYAEVKLHRSLTGEEAYALAGHLYKLEQAKSYLTALGAGGGVWRWYTTWEQCRYPLYKPAPKDINPNKFLFIKGPAANYARHSWRLFCYTFVAAELGKLAGQIMAQPVSAQDTLKDPRLAQFTADLRTAVSSEMPRMGNRTARSSADERRAAWEEAAKARNAQRSSPSEPAPVSWNTRKPTSADDDMSPTAGNEPWPSSSDNAWGDAPFPSDTFSNSQPRQQPTNPYSQPPRQSRRSEDDDASPTGGMFQDEMQNQSKPGESAWERLRRGGPPGTPPSMNRRQPPYQGQNEGSTMGDSFTFAEDDDLKREKGMAQKRQGKDYDEERRW